MNTFHIRYAKPTEDGAGVKIRRISEFTGRIDPFLMVDELKSSIKDDYIGGFPPHPHRGFETLTYLLHGGLSHRDSEGHQGGVSRGGAQWMRAGSGIVHSEMPTTDSDGLHGFQVWINLPASLKMSTPTYRDVQASEIPQVTFTGGEARLIADRWQFNEISGEGAMTTLGDGAGMADVSLDANATVEVKLPEGYRLIAYVYNGAVSASRQDAVIQGKAENGGLMVFDRDDQTVRLHSETASGVLLLSGKPLDEPIAHRGPFVMNTAAELQQAMLDYQSGAMGRLDR
ncbi:MAG: nuclease PIN [Halothiobacillus sp. 14-56-357]|jgi:redox-sensitive bicupin YhaK (pirin superfamily)|uniref:pirin family protein n=1 Tax=Halothiobacillus sp. 15-55-196 TaxID=1970382 RepID=UPI000BDD2160|nr:pirin family protein [Halothiobacillus sp. 15-55-196]OZB37259.1 MAG: nuclease PIN [Halothiobacillus sp. 15-55-196]OZB56535.1 MAG: nuclease PIN [Halothiobacillus sp. 14-56-357]OZB78331.1 MAG: nuclease PIN [Halothiobacillus sp. 13-55-115]